LENAKVDPRVELLSITFRLADAEEFKSTYFESYVEDINTYLLHLIIGMKCRLSAQL